MTAAHPHMLEESSQEVLTFVPMGTWVRLTLMANGGSKMPAGGSGTLVADCTSARPALAVQHAFKIYCWRHITCISTSTFTRDFLFLVLHLLQVATIQSAARLYAEQQAYLATPACKKLRGCAVVFAPCIEFIKKMGMRRGGTCCCSIYPQYRNCQVHSCQSICHQEVFFD